MGNSDYDDEDVETFTQVIDSRDFDRIQNGLSKAVTTLRPLPPEKRRQNALERQSIYALFEALACQPFLERDGLLLLHFDEAFELVQTKRPLTVAHYVPAMTAFSFHQNQKRSTWAKHSWQKVTEHLTEDNFDFAVRRPLSRELDVILMTMPDSAGVDRFWNAMHLIIEKLTPDLITHSLRSMEQDVYRLALDHMQVDSPGLQPLLQSLQILLIRGPKDFWDAMGAIAPTTVVEHVFNSPHLDHFVKLPPAPQPSSPLDAVLGWIIPFMTSLQTSHKPAACRSLTFQLLTRLQADRFSPAAKNRCYQTGMGVLSRTLENCSGSGIAFDAVRRIAATDTLAVLWDHRLGLMDAITRPANYSKEASHRDICISTLTRAIKLECNLLSSDRDNIAKATKAHSNSGPYFPVFWELVKEYIKPGCIELAQISLAGMSELVGLEKFDSKQTLSPPQEQKSFNATLEKSTKTLSSILDSISDWNSKSLQALAEDSGAASYLLSPLFSSEQNVSEFGADLLRNISEAPDRRGAVSYLLRLWPRKTLDTVVHAVKRIGTRRAFAPCPRMLKVCTDVVDALCNSQDGVLRTTTIFANLEDAVRVLWASLWRTLRTIYIQTQEWSEHVRVAIMSDFCRDVMQFSDRLVQEYSVFYSATEMKPLIKREHEEAKASVAADEEMDDLLIYPSNTLPFMIKYLKLRDEYLLSTSVELIRKLLLQLSGKNLKLESNASDELERLTSKQKVTNMTNQQKAEVLRALEENLGHPVGIDRVDEGVDQKSRLDAKSALRQGPINIVDWAQKSKIKSEIDSDILSLSPSVELLKAQHTLRTPSPTQRSASSIPSKAKKLVLPPAVEKKKEAEKEAFLRSREQAKREKKLRDAEAVAKAKKHLMPNSMAGQTSGEGSALSGIGDLGKEHQEKGAGIMVSSESESSGSDDELDRELFGSPKKSKQPDAVRDYNASKLKQLKVQGPTKKQRKVRSMKDMRARVAPDLSPLHRVILAWNFFHDGDFPPETRRENYTQVATAFSTAMEYRDTFEPLLLLEEWSSFQQAREERSAKPFKVETKSRMSLDNLIEISSTIDPSLQKDRAVSEGDVLLLSKESLSAVSADQPNCLARVFKVTRKANALEMTFRVAHGTPMNDYLGLNVAVYAEKVTSVIPLEREYGALLGLVYYDLCDEIIKAYPSPLLPYSEQVVSRVSRIYDLNTAQSKAVQSATDNDAFTLIQGPPGSGKTKTIVAIVGALLTEALKISAAVPIAVPMTSSKLPGAVSGTPVPKKLLVCAPSNAAVDELVMRFMQGVKTYNGTTHKVSVLRLGRSESINPKVLEVTLDELVNKRINATVEKMADGDDVGKVMLQHKATCEQLNGLRAQLDERSAKGLAASAEQNHELEVLKRRKTQLGNQIDRMKDSGHTQARNKEIRRHQIRQEIIDGAHVICATLSGSGHDMFRTLKVDFETVIIDEAAQSVEMSALIPLKYGCSKCIMVGDPKQLPPTVLSREAAKSRYEQSLFVRMQQNSPDNVHLLDTQYRMHPDISSFPSQTFYDGRLLDGPGMAAARNRPWHADDLLGPYRFFDVQGMHQSAPKGHSLINIAEAELALRLFRRLTASAKDFDLSGKVGIITPYKSQLALLRDRFQKAFGEEIKDAVDFNTTDAFQGRESEVIIFSCVRASQSGIGFLADIRRMNVGITRAKSSLWVLGNASSLSQGEYWGRMIDDARRRNKFTADTSKAIQGVPPSGPRAQPIQPRGRAPDAHGSLSGPPRRTPVAPSHKMPSPSSDISMPDAPPMKQSPSLTHGQVAASVVSTSTAPSTRMGTDRTHDQQPQSTITAPAPAMPLASRPFQTSPPTLANGSDDTKPTGEPHEMPAAQNGQIEHSLERKRELPSPTEPPRHSKASKISGPGPNQQGYRVAKPPIPRPKKKDDSSIFVKPKPRRK